MLWTPNKKRRRGSLMLTGAGRASPSAFNPLLLPSPLALWKLDEGSGAVAKNTFAATVNPGTNLCPAPEQAFANTIYWAPNLCTATDYYANNPDGNATASRLNFSSGNSYISVNVTGAAGQYTWSAWFKSNTGTDQTVRLSIQDATGGIVDSSALVVTAAGGWQQKQFTHTAAGALQVLYIRNDGSNASDVQAWGAQLEAAASAGTYRRQTLDLIVSNGSRSLSWSSTGLDDSNGNHYALALENIPTTLNQVTVYAAVRQTADHTYGFVLKDLASYTNLGAPIGSNSPGQGGLFAGTSINLPSSLADSAWHILCYTYDGTNASYYVDGTLMKTSAQSATPFALTGLLAGFNSFQNFGHTGAPGRGDLAFYAAGHTLSQAQSMTQYLQGVMAAKGASAVNMAKFVLLEGDSITANLGLTVAEGYPYIAMYAISPLVQWTNNAVSGSTVANVAARATVDNLSLTPRKTKSVLFVFIGANDQSLGAATFFANLKTYCLAMRAAGWIVVVATLLPQTTVGFNTFRNAANVLINGDSSFYDAKADFGADATMGPDAAAADTGLYQDGVHPTAAGQAILGPIAQTAIASVL